MTTLDPQDNHVALIDAFQVEPGRAEELTEPLHHASEAMSTPPGFVSADLHVSEDDSGRRTHVMPSAGCDRPRESS